MSNIDLITILGNLSQALVPVERLVTGISYLAGIVLVYSGVFRFKKIGSAGGQSQEHYFSAVALLVAGAALLFLPTSIQIISYSTFGTENILSYSNYNKQNIFQSMSILIQTAGLIWFARGCIMVVHASEPGEQHGLRGLFFIVTGMLAMNFVLTMSMIAYVENYLVHWSITFNKV